MTLRKPFFYRGTIGGCAFGLQVCGLFQSKIWKHGTRSRRHQQGNMMRIDDLSGFDD